MDSFCGNCRFINTGASGLTCKIYNSHLQNDDSKVLRLVKCKFENSKVNKALEKK